MRSHAIIVDSMLSTSCFVCFYACVQFFLSRQKFFLLTYNNTLALRLSLIRHSISFWSRPTVTDLRAERLQKRSLSREERVNFCEEDISSWNVRFLRIRGKRRDSVFFFLCQRKTCIFPPSVQKSHHIYYSVTRERNVETFTDFHKIVYYNVDFKTLQTSLIRVVSTVRSKLTLDQQICTAHTFR